MRYLTQKQFEKLLFTVATHISDDINNNTSIWELEKVNGGTEKVKTDYWNNTPVKEMDIAEIEIDDSDSNYDQGRYLVSGNYSYFRLTDEQVEEINADNDILYELFDTSE